MSTELLPLEVAANTMNTVSIFLAGRNRIHTWWTGIVGCGLFAVLFYESRLYAEVNLQVFFVGTSLLGWWWWRASGGPDQRAVTHAPRHTFLWLLPLAVLAATAYGAMLQAWTDAAAAFADSAVLSFSVAAQVLLMQRRVQSWPLWVVVNAIAVPLFASRGLYLTAALYALYGVNALVAWRHWTALAAASPRTSA